MIRTNLIDSMGLSARSAAAVKALLKSPAAANALAEQEATNIATRRELLEAQARVGAPHQKPVQSASAAYARAIAHRENIQAELKTAYESERSAMSAMIAAQASEWTARNGLEHDLLATADPRIGTFDFVLDLLDDAARNALTFFPKVDPTITAKQSGLEWNTAAVKAARDAIHSCRVQCDVLRHEVITYADLTTRFDAMCESLADPLAGVELNPPQIDAEGSVGRALHWDMRRRAWRVETMWNGPRQPEPITDKAGKKVRLA